MAGPLSSLKVLDFSTLLPGPVGTMVLADLGADIIRIESPTRPDMVRMMPPMVGNVSAAHAYLNRSKRSVAVDLKKPQGVELIHQMVKDYDIVVEQFRPGVMKKLGVDYEALKAINPRIIFCSITGYGQDGPYRDRAGHDLNYLAIAGMTSYNGRRSGGPQPMAFQAADVAGGSCHAVMAILAAVIHRQQTGEGQYIDISMTDAAFSLHALTAPSALQTGESPDLENTQLNGGSFYDCYETADGRWFSVAGLEPQFFSQFCTAIGRPDLSGLGLAMAPDIVGELKANIAKEMKKKTFAQWQEVFINIDSCSEPVLNFIEASEHPQMQARAMVVNVANAKGESHRQVASPFKFSQTQPTYRFAGAALGEHTDELLAEMGVAADGIVALRKEGVVS
jgi:crotonobetainyl-CoA:carnitine CoA-transferase CaiB-like acyl-CoA transferase